MRDVVISIRSIHGYGSEDQDCIDFTTDGKYSYDGCVGRLSYLESEVTGLPGTKTSVEISKNGVSVDRKGFVTSHMVFREGGRDVFQYNTPFGMANMDMSTHKIRHSFNENGGSMEIDYVLDLEHAIVLKNKFQMKVEPREGETKNG